MIILDHRGHLGLPLHRVLSCAHARSCVTLCESLDCSPPGSFVRGIFSGKDNGVGCHVLLQGIFPTQGSPVSPVLQADSLPTELCLGRLCYTVSVVHTWCYELSSEHSPLIHMLKPKFTSVTAFGEMVFRRK